MNSSLIKVKTLTTKTIIAVLTILIIFFVSSRTPIAKEITINLSTRQQTDAPRSWIGTKGTMAFFVKSVQPGTPAEKVGFKLGDVLISLNDEDVTSVDNFPGRIWQSEPGTSFRIKYLRFAPAKQQWDENNVTVQTIAAQTSATVPNVQFLKIGNAGIQCDCPTGCCAACDSSSGCVDRCFFTGFSFCVNNPCSRGGLCA